MTVVTTVTVVTLSVTLSVVTCMYDTCTSTFRKLDHAGRKCTFENSNLDTLKP